MTFFTGTDLSVRKKKSPKFRNKSDTNNCCGYLESDRVWIYFCILNLHTSAALPLAEGPQQQIQARLALQQGKGICQVKQRGRHPLQSSECSAGLTEQQPEQDKGRDSAKGFNIIYTVPAFLQSWQNIAEQGDTDGGSPEHP